MFAHHYKKSSKPKPKNGSRIQWSIKRKPQKDLGGKISTPKIPWIQEAAMNNGGQIRTRFSMDDGKFYMGKEIN